MSKVLSLGFLAMASMIGLAMCYGGGGGGGFQKMGQQSFGGYPKYMPRMMSYGYGGGYGGYGGGIRGGRGGGGFGGGIIGFLIFIFILLFVVGLLFDDDSGSGGFLGIGK